MRILLEHLKSHLAPSGVETANYKSYKLKNRLLKTFGDKLSFWQPGERNKSEIVFSARVPRGQIVEAGLRIVSDSMVNLDSDDSESESTTASFSGTPVIWFFSNFISRLGYLAAW